MARSTPSKCERGLDCEPLHAVVSDDGCTFVCGGLHGGGGADLYRVCFKSETTDSMYDYDTLDLLDTVEVISRLLSTAGRLRPGLAWRAHGVETAR